MSVDLPKPSLMREGKGLLQPNFMEITMNRKFVLLLIVCLLFVSVFSVGAEEVPPAGLEPLAEITDEFVTGELLIQFEKDTTESDLATLLASYGATYDRRLTTVDIEIWLVPAGQELALSQTLTAHPAITFAEPNYYYTVLDNLIPNDSGYGNQWAHNRMDSPQAWDLSTGTATITTAILDTGVDLGHPDLAAKIVPGYDFIQNDNDPGDKFGHGTHVAGIAAAIGNNGIGVAGLDWQSRIMPVRVLDSQGSGTSGQIIDGINWAYMNGADIINMSLGGPGYSSGMQTAVTNAHNSGTLVIAAIGNCRTGGGGCPGTNPTMYPAAYTNVLAVSSTKNNDTYSYFSQYGNHNDVSAPGGEMFAFQDPGGIYSTMPTYNVYLTGIGYNNNYDYLQGTSMAAPQVAGLAGLIWSLNPALTPNQVQNIIEISADDLGPAGWDGDYGHGRINAYQALLSVIPSAPTLLTISNPDGDGNYPLDWDNISSATSYTLQEDDNPGFASPSTVYTGPADQYDIFNRDMGNYYYRVRANNAGGSSAWSNTQSATVLPSAPLLLAINNGDGDGDYVVDWDVVLGATSYTLEEASAASFSNATTLYTGTNTDFNVTGNPAGVWYYRVKATAAIGDSLWSNIETAGVLPSAPALDPITNPTNLDNYQLNWATIAGADGYTLEEANNPAFTGAQIRYMGNMTSYDITGQAGDTWYYRVRAYNGAGNSAWSNVENTVVDPSPIPAPILEPIANGGDSDFVVDWNDVTGAVSYILERSDNPYFVNPTVVYTGLNSTASLTDHPEGTWYYRVRAVGAVPIGPWSNTESVFVTITIHLPVIFN